MTASNFTKLLAPLARIEGAISDRPLKADPGGLTNKGVTQGTYDVYRASKGLSARSVRELTRPELIEVYRRQFWDTVRGDDLPSGLDWAVFDFSVNSGPGRAIKELQRILGCNVDGVIGLITLGAIAKADTATAIDHLCDRRLAFMKGLKNWGANKNGWTRRVADVRAAALAMAGDAPAAAIVLAPLPAAAAVKAPEAAQSQLKTPEGAGLTIAAAGAGGEKVRQFAEGIQPHMSTDTVLGRLAFAVFTLLMLLGGCLVGYAYAKRVQERGGLGGFVGSVFKGQAT
ncbi:MAG: glycoside hydrolase family 108 protein [Phenylobacterium sp.]